MRAEGWDPDRTQFGPNLDRVGNELGPSWARVGPELGPSSGLAAFTPDDALELLEHGGYGIEPVGICGPATGEIHGRYS